MGGGAVEQENSTYFQGHGLFPGEAPAMWQEPLQFSLNGGGFIRATPHPPTPWGLGAVGTNPHPNHKSNPNRTIEIPPPCVPQSKQ